MFEPGKHYFRVRLTRGGEDAHVYFLFAFDVDDAVARAKKNAAQAKGQGLTDDNPFDDLDRLEAYVKQLG